MFEWEGELERMLSETSVIRVRAVLDYMKKGKPVNTACKWKGGRTAKYGVFYGPTSIAICPQSENIYISDGATNCVQVFTKSFEFLFKFCEKMTGPFSMFLSQNKLFITQFVGNSLNVYSTGGKPLHSVGRKGSKELEFDKPFSVSITPVRNRIYICDFGNLRIQCLNSNLTFNSFILDISIMRIHCTSDEIIVLKVKIPCISFYDYSHQLVREILPIGEGTPILAIFASIIETIFSSLTIQLIV